MNKIKFDIDRLFAIAEERVRQRLERESGNCSETLDELFDDLSDVIVAMRKIYQPQATMVELECQLLENGVALPNGDSIGNVAMQQAISASSKVISYLMTTGHDSNQALKLWQNDYLLHHLHHLFARELLWQQGREVQAEIERCYPDLTFRRYAISAVIETEDEEENSYIHQSWEPKIVMRMINLFSDNLGIKVIDSGCFSPVYTILGLTIGRETSL
jgi:hypothetical protein